MKRVSKLAIAVAAVLVIAMGVQTADAACSVGRLIRADGTRIVANPDCDPAGPGSTAGGFQYGCGFDTGPALSSNLQGFFWAQGTGNPAGGAGNDNGAWGVSNWVTLQSPAPDAYPTPYGLYYFDLWYLAVAGGTVPGWNSDSQIDGCVDASGPTPGVDGTECTCVYLEDVFEAFDGMGNSLGLQSYAAIVGAQVDAFGNYDLSQGGNPILLGPVGCNVMSATRDPNTFDTSAMIAASIPTFINGNCNCLAGFQVLQNRVARGGPQPTNDLNDASWEPIGGVNAFSAAAQITIPAACTDINNPLCNEDVYIACRTVGEGAAPFGGQAATVMPNSRIQSGPTIADPDRPGRGRRPIDVPVPRGRGKGLDRDR